MTALPIADLSSATVETRLAACSAVADAVERGTPLDAAVEPVVALLADPDPRVKGMAEYILQTEAERDPKGRGVDGLRWGLSHEVESVRRADCIYVLEAGRVVEQGTHDGLLAKGGRYRALHDKQSGFTEAADGSVQVTAERLRRVPLLASLSLELLEPLARSFTTERFEAGQVVFPRNAN